MSSVFGCAMYSSFSTSIREIELLYDVSCRDSTDYIYGMDENTIC